MKATIKQARNNDRNLKVLISGQGHWRIKCDYRGKEISCITTNSIDVDNWNSEEWETDKDGKNMIKQGYENLCSEIIYANKNRK
jgi:hypothetical protein